MIYNLSGISVNVSLKPGIYELPTDAAIGKSYLAKLLNTTLDDSVCVLTYSVDFTEDFYLNKLSKEFKLVVCDRFNKYRTRAINERIKELENCVVLLDAKNANVLFGLNTRFTKLNRTETLIEVSE